MISVRWKDVVPGAQVQLGRMTSEANREAAGYQAVVVEKVVGPKGTAIIVRVPEKRRSYTISLYNIQAIYN